MSFTASDSKYAAADYTFSCLGQSSSAPADAEQSSASGNQLTLVDKNGATNLYTKKSRHRSMPQVDAMAGMAAVVKCPLLAGLGPPTWRSRRQNPAVGISLLQTGHKPPGTDDLKR